MDSAITFVGIVAYVGTPAVLILGWVQWFRRPKQGAFSLLSLISFVVGTASALLAIGVILYAREIEGFPYHDPRLMRIFRLGFLLSLGGIVVALGGVWRRNTLRWYAPCLSLGMLMLWLVWSSSE